MKHDYHIAVIGAGSGGLVVASGAAGLGAKVALIEGHKMGGDCLNYGCVPSKTFLKSAHRAAEIRDAHHLGLNDANCSPNLASIMDRVSAVIQEIKPHDSKERYEGLGVTVLEGYGALVDAHTVSINGSETITAKYIVIATGSTAMLPPIPGLSESPHYTNHTIFNLRTLPKRLIVFGAGPIGLELGQGFHHLGSQVTMVDMLPTLFVKDDPEVAPIMEEALRKEGIQLQLGTTIKEIVTHSNSTVTVHLEKNGQAFTIDGDAILVSLGRRPVTKGLNCDGVGVKTTPQGYIITNQRLQTNIPSIYACGDVVGPYQFTHMAGVQAGVIIRNTVLKLPAKWDDTAVPWVTYTRPEVAHVGMTEAMAKERGMTVESVKIDLQAMDRSKAENDRIGFLKCIYTNKKRLIGATLVSEKAGEIIPLASMAIQNKMKITTFMGLIFAYPTQAEIFKFAALSVAKESLKPWMKSLISRII